MTPMQIKGQAWAVETADELLAGENSVTLSGPVLVTFLRLAFSAGFSAHVLDNAARCVAEAESIHKPVDVSPYLERPAPVVDFPAASVTLGPPAVVHIPVWEAPADDKPPPDAVDTVRQAGLFGEGFDDGRWED